MSRNIKSKVTADKRIARKRKTIKDLVAKDVKQVKGGYQRGWDIEANKKL